MTHSAEIVEIFSSPQGEGPYAGQMMTFVRFGRCNLRCNYCDTPRGLCHQEVCSVEHPPSSGIFTEIPNPVSVTRLCEEIGAFGENTISVTGGEPLEQSNFLAEWLPAVSPLRHILLETNGVLHSELEKVLPYIHIVSMDFKLPSSSGQKPLWNEHTTFLRMALAAGKDVYVKIVVTAKTTDLDIQRVIVILTHEKKYVPLIIQPASSTLTFRETISEERLRSFERLLQAYLPHVSTIPQMHKQWGVM